MSTTTESDPRDDLDLIWSYVLIGGDQTEHVRVCKALRSLENYIKTTETLREV